MVFKLLGACLIMCAGLGFGGRQADKLRSRVAELDEFRLALRLLIAEVGYTATPLPRALDNVIVRLRNPEVHSFFQEVCKGLKSSRQVADATIAWTEAAARVRGELNLRDDDWAVILRAAAGLGCLGRENQVKQLELADSQLALISSEASAVSRKNEKMWRYLGALGGISLVIILL